MTEASRQADFIVAPQRGAVWVLNVTATSAPFDLTALAKLGTYISFQADGNDVYVDFGVDNTVTVDDAATGTPSTNGGAKIPANATFSIKLKPGLDAFMAAKCATGNTAKLRVWQSGTPRVT